MSGNKRYCIFSALYLPHMGGVERYTYNLAKELIKRGNQVTVVTSNTEGLPAYEILEEIRIYRLPCIPMLEGRYPVLKPDREFWKIHRILKKKHFDLVMINTRFYVHSLYGIIFARKMHARCFVLDHGTSHLMLHNRFLDAAEQVFEHTITAVEKMLCRDFYGVSLASCKWLEHFHIKAVGPLYNSIDLEEVEKIRKNSSSFSWRKQLGIPADALVITFTGRLLEEKGIPSLLRVMERIHEEYPQVQLCIAGDGDLEDMVKRYQSEYIHYLGRLEFSQIVALLDETDIFCLPSFSEGFSTSILEAAACRCYVVTTARGGAKELLLNDDYGCVIPNNQEDILYKALEQVIPDIARREKGIALTYDKVKTNFSWHVVADQMESICENE